MTDYRQLMLLVLQGRSYREIVARQGCSMRTIAKVRKVLTDQQIDDAGVVRALTFDEIDGLFGDGRKSVSADFVPVDIDGVVAARVGRSKPPLKVLWARYLETPAGVGVRHYGYERFCQIVAEHVRVHDLTAPIRHVPGHTMQVDWAGTQMVVVDPVTGERARVSLFVASMPYSGLVFARGYLDQKQGAWLDGHRRAFEYVGGVPLLVVPDNASTASSQISKASRARDVNRVYADFLEYYQTAAVPTRSAAPRDKGNVEAAVKVVTHWVAQYLKDRVFACLEDLNEAVEERVEWINDRTPFRGEGRSRAQWFTEVEKNELMALPKKPWEPVTWRKAKVHRDWHIQLDTVKYSVPYEHAGLNVEVRIIGDKLDVITDSKIVATHQRGRQRNMYVTNPEHAPKYLEETTGLWTRAYFLRQAAKAGPGTVAALTRLLDAKVIEAQGFRSCMNILDLGKRGGRQLLEQACQHLTETDPQRPISYTAVKNTMTALRTQNDSRPSSLPQGPPPTNPPASTVRDTTGAHLAGPQAFSLSALANSQTRKA